MKAKDISNLYWFCQSVECGGFAAASLKTKVSAPTLSRAVAQLEEQLSEKLVHRNAKQFQLTTAGEEYYLRFSSIFNQLDEEWIQLSNNQPELTGDIHISCPEPFADYFLQQLAIEFMQDNPRVNIHINFASDTDRFFDDQIDLAVVTTPAQASHLVQRQLFKSQLALAASPAYLAKHGTPESPEQLLDHHLLAGNTMPYWELKQDNETFRLPISKPKYSVNSLRLTIQAAKTGLGVCLMPLEALKLFEQSEELVQILPDVKCPSGNAYIVWSDRVLISARVAAFRDMIYSRMNNPDEFLTTVIR
ncbi:LysR family transcriptional regulator [Vibrio sp. HN007]|uniref:LysR family transcriptional regulator n=1 Tax=Vibrio iocasae TaxID=3098914 RepID=UPI0035D4FF07